MGLRHQEPRSRSRAIDAHHSVQMIFAVTAQGLLRFSLFTGSCTAAVFLAFCKKTAGRRARAGPPVALDSTTGGPDGHYQRRCQHVALLQRYRSGRVGSYGDPFPAMARD